MQTLKHPTLAGRVVEENNMWEYNIRVHWNIIASVLGWIEIWALSLSLDTILKLWFILPENIGSVSWMYYLAISSDWDFFRVDWTDIHSVSNWPYLVYDRSDRRYYRANWELKLKYRAYPRLFIKDWKFISL